MNKRDTLFEQLQVLGLRRDEAKLYLELLRGPSTHLKLAQATGINRTKVYRLAGELEKRSLITKRVDDRGAFLVAADPATLEVALVTQEENLKGQRLALDGLLPVLDSMRQGDRSSFIVQTYDGTEGFKQMLWHELKTEGEALVLGSGTIEDLVGDRRWAEKHRAKTVQAGYRVRELLNPGGKPEHFTENTAFLEQSFAKRLISPKLLALSHGVVIYNDTVALYHWRANQKVGVEIIDKSFANLQRQVFEHYWQLAEG
ncbi:MAG TPA: helix-turn-helix domain-containing protein [Candidatus Saccharimonadales bacterium]|nr:helix-turn-helix domain-containing protein [Candidatus Saccharimonadales bacterium]